MDNDGIKWFIRIITALVIIPIVILLPWHMITTETFSVEYSVLTLLLILIVWLLFKIDNLVGIAILYVIASCVLIYLGGNNDPNLRATINAISTDKVISENILSVDYTSNNSDVLHIGFDNTYYYVFKQNETGTIELMKLPCDNTIITEVDTYQKPTYNLIKSPDGITKDRKIIVTKDKYKLIKQ